MLYAALANRNATFSKKFIYELRSINRSKHIICQEQIGLGRSELGWDGLGRDGLEKNNVSNKNLNFINLFKFK